MRKIVLWVEEEPDFTDNDKEFIESLRKYKRNDTQFVKTEVPVKPSVKK
jgi:hypothetical protein